jgi:hypothetical protein
MAQNLENVAATITAETSTLLQHTSQESRAVYSGATKAQADIAATAGAQAQAIAAACAKASELRAQGYSEASRIASGDSDRLRADALETIKASAAQAYLMIAATAATLRASAVPPTAPESQRGLHRAELDAAIGEGGFQAVSGLAALAAQGDSDGLSGEAFGDYARRRLTQGLSTGEADKLWNAYRTVALASRLSLPRYAAVSTALQGLGRARGGVDAAVSAAKIRLGA